MRRSEATTLTMVDCNVYFTTMIKKLKKLLIVNSALDIFTFIYCTGFRLLEDNTYLYNGIVNSARLSLNHGNRSNRRVLNFLKKSTISPSYRLEILFFQNHTFQTNALTSQVCS